MKLAKISLTISPKTCPEGREIVRFTPVFTPDVTASGSLSFAFYDAWKDEPETHAEKQMLAIKNARRCMQLFAEVVQIPRDPDADLAMPDLAPSLAAVLDIVERCAPSIWQLSQTVKLAKETLAQAQAVRAKLDAIKLEGEE